MINIQNNKTHKSSTPLSPIYISTLEKSDHKDSYNHKGISLI